MSGAGETVEIVRRPERFGALEPAWTRLWGASGASVFQSHAWLSAWWSTLPARRRPRLHLGLLWREGRIVAALPLAVTRRRGLRALEWAAKEYCDYGDALILPGETDALRRLWRHLHARGGFDLAYLSHLRGDAHALGLGQQPSLAPSRRAEVNLRVRGPWPNGAAWFDALPKKPRQNDRRGRKALEAAGSVSFRLVDDVAGLERALVRLMSLKRDWLLRTGQRSGLLDDDRILRAFVDVLRRSGLLRLFVIELDGDVVAGTVNFVEGDRMCAFFAAYDASQERASLGMLLMVDYIRWAFDHGLAEVDFLGGAEEYKLRYADTRLDLVSLMGGRTLVGRLAVALDRKLAERRERAEHARLPKRRKPAAVALPSGSG